MENKEIDYEYEYMSLFQQLNYNLNNLIRSLPAGARLPSEPILAASLGVSRATLREAMRNFEGQGMIRRRQGVGTFVVDHQQNIETGLEALESIETIASRAGLDVKMGYLEINDFIADDEYAKKFNITEGAKLVRITRVIWIDDRPVAYLVDSVLPNSLDKKDMAEGFTGSVLDLFIKRGKPELSHSKTEVLACAAPQSIAKKLQLQRGDVLLKLDAVLHDKDNNVVDYSQSYFVPGFFKFHVNRSIGL